MTYFTKTEAEEIINNLHHCSTDEGWSYLEDILDEKKDKIINQFIYESEKRASRE